MRFSRGVVKIPVKHVYLFIIVVASVLFIIHEVSKYKRNKSQAVCKIPTLTPRHKLTSPRGGKLRNNHSKCLKQPVYTRWEDCPHCFRPTIRNISNHLHQVLYNTTMFPRGPPGTFKMKDTIQQELVSDYLITPHKVCSSPSPCPYLVAVQLSVAGEVGQRNDIRLTWGSVAKTKLWPYADINAEVKVVFVLAHQTEMSYLKEGFIQKPSRYIDKENYPTIREWANIQEESDMHGDILYLDMQDSYYNLTLKLMSAFKWVRDNCQMTPFILKVDADTFVNVPLLVDMLIFNQDRLEFSVTGLIYTNSRAVHRSERWAVDPKIYPPPMFPAYASGCAYVISANLLSQMVDVTPYAPMNTVITGVLSTPFASAEELYVSGLLQIILGYDLFTVGNNFFAPRNEKGWFFCDMIHDYKVFGKLSTVTDVYKLWRSFVRYYGKCWKEDPNLARPKGF